MARESLRHVADFYSVRAEYPLGKLEQGKVTVVGSDRRYERRWRSVLWIAVFPDRALLSTQHELVGDMQDVVASVSEPSQLLRDEVKERIIAACYRAGCREGDFQIYNGVELWCGQGTYVRTADTNVRPITVENAAEAIGALRSVGIPDGVGYLLTDKAAFAYYEQDRPVAFAGTHPVGAFSDRVGNIMVGTLKAYRRRGHGKAVASATTGELLRQGRVVVWGTSPDNVAALRTAASVGFRPYCQVFEVRFRQKDPHLSTA